MKYVINVSQYIPLSYNLHSILRDNSNDWTKRNVLNYYRPHYVSKRISQCLWCDMQIRGKNFGYFDRAFDFYLVSLLLLHEDNSISG